MCRSNSSIKWNHRHNLQTWRWPPSGHAYFTGMIAQTYKMGTVNVLKWFVLSEVCIPCLYCPYEIWCCHFFFKWCMIRLPLKLDLLSCPTVFYVSVSLVNSSGMGKEERKSKNKTTCGLRQKLFNKQRRSGRREKTKWHKLHTRHIPWVDQC